MKVDIGDIDVNVGDIVTLQNLGLQFKVLDGPIMVEEGVYRYNVIVKDLKYLGWCSLGYITKPKPEPETYKKHREFL